MAASHGHATIAALQATVHRVLERLAHELADLGLTHGEINALAHLTPDHPVTVGELLEATGQRPSTLTGVLDRLERRGHVTRELTPGDRRSFTVALTGSGDAAGRRVRRAFADFDRRALASVSERSAQGFFEVLAALDGLGGSQT
jgi:DNA-binding MarR family transcriptional regulator